MNSSQSDVVVTPRRQNGQTQVVFVRLDPLLQELLQSLTHYQELVGRSSAEQNNNDNNGPRKDDHDETNNNNNVDQLVIQNIQSTIRILEKLQNALEQLGPPFALSLILLADYISLPLTAIFHVKTDDQKTHRDEEHKDPNEGRRRWQIQRSYVRKLYCSTANVIGCYVQTCCSVPHSDDRMDDALRTSLKSSHLIKFLISLANAFPTSGGGGGDRKADDIFSNTLDDGSDLWISLLDTIMTILSVCDEDLSEAWDGTLVARLVDCMTMVLASSKQQEVCFKSLQALQCLLESSSKHSLWQSIFPGIFASLYRHMVGLHRQKSYGLSVSIECQLLSVLTKLFQVTLLPLANRDFDDTQTKSAKALIQQLEIIAKKSQTDSQTKEEEEAEPSNFVTEMNQRVVAPLSVLLRQEAISPSDKVRLEVLSLSSILLIDTRKCWTSTRMKETSLEICLMLQVDAEGTFDG